MGKTSISWTGTVLHDGTVLSGYSFNPWIGCTKVSQGCAHCYAETQNKRYNWNSAGWGVGKPRKRTSESNWLKPIQWSKEARAAGVTRRIFCASLADVFDGEVPQEWRNDLWSLTCKAVNLEWLLLTKRPENIEKMLPAEWIDNPPDWIRIGVTAEDQPNADLRIPALLKAWRGKNFISYEPAIGPLHMRNHFWPIHWIICGGESGAGCRPFSPEWARSIMNQCKNAQVPFFAKQLGGHSNKRDDLNDFPADLQIREFPI